MKSEKGELMIFLPVLLVPGAPLSVCGSPAALLLKPETQGSPVMVSSFTPYVQGPRLVVLTQN